MTQSIIQQSIFNAPLATQAVVTGSTMELAESTFQSKADEDQINTLESQYKGANDQFFSITGICPSRNKFILPNKHEGFTVETLQTKTQVEVKAQKFHVPVEAGLESLKIKWILPN